MSPAPMQLGRRGTGACLSLRTVKTSSVVGKGVEEREGRRQKGDVSTEAKEKEDAHLLQDLKKKSQAAASPKWSEREGDVVVPLNPFWIHPWVV